MSRKYELVGEKRIPLRRRTKKKIIVKKGIRKSPTITQSKSQEQRVNE